MKEKEIFIFDIDGTLTESKMPLSSDMAMVLRLLLSDKKVALISGATFEQMTGQILRKMCEDSSDFNFLKNMYLLPTSGACLYSYVGAKSVEDIASRKSWKEEYAEFFSKEEKDLIFDALNQAIESDLYPKPEQLFGEVVEDRGSQITFSGLGQHAPYVLKKSWDPDMKIRSKLVEFIKDLIPQFELKIGGSTSIDIVKPGINKAFGVIRLLQRLAIPVEKAVFFGDALFEGGNDYSVISSGVQCVSVKTYHDTVQILSELVEMP